MKRRKNEPMTVTVTTTLPSWGTDSHHVGHILGDPEVVAHCCFCFGGETRYLTRDGAKSFAETVGTSQFVLTSDPHDRTGGRWVEAHIHSFGEQSLLAVTLRRNKITKVVLATAEHDWLVKKNTRTIGEPTRLGPKTGASRGVRSNSCSRGHLFDEANTRLRKDGSRACKACAALATGGRDTDRLAKTIELRPGQRLSHLRLPGVGGVVPDHDGIRHGIVFGDGTAAGSGANVTLWGEKDKQLLPYFASERQKGTVTPNGVPGVRVASGRLKAWMKSVPSLDKSPEYLYGWLAGYFAADGSVSKAGQVHLSSSNITHLEAVRDVARSIGIETYGITSCWRKGFPDREPSLLHQVEFVGDTLSEEFFLTETHRDRFLLSDRGYARFGWTVDSVKETGFTEEVFCAVVPGTHTFALEDNIWVGNCGSGDIVAGGDQTISCTFCNRSFLVMEQPNYNSMPGQPGATTDATMPGGGAAPGAPGDPMAPEVPGDPAAAPTDPAAGPAASAAPDHTPVNPQTDPSTLKKSPPFKFGGSVRKDESIFRTASGYRLDEDDFVRHVAFQVDRDFLVGG